MMHLPMVLHTSILYNVESCGNIVHSSTLHREQWTEQKLQRKTFYNYVSERMEWKKNMHKSTDIFINEGPLYKLRIWVNHVFLCC